MLLYVLLILRSFLMRAHSRMFTRERTKGERAGEKCVGKIFKSGSAFEESYFANELKV